MPTSHAQLPFCKAEVPPLVQPPRQQQLQQADAQLACPPGCPSAAFPPPFATGVAAAWAAVAWPGLRCLQRRLLHLWLRLVQLLLVSLKKTGGSSWLQLWLLRGSRSKRQLRGWGQAAQGHNQVHVAVVVGRTLQRRAGCPGDFPQVAGPALPAAAHAPI